MPYSGKTRSIKYPTSMLLRPKREKSLTMMQLTFPARTASINSCTAGRSKFVPLYPLSMNSTTSALRIPSIVSAYLCRAIF